MGANRQLSIRMLIGVHLLILFTTASHAIEPTRSIGPLAERDSSKKLAASSDIEQSVLNLVEKHLPELDAMLDRLRSDNRKQYDIAIRDLSRWTKRLESAKKRDAKLYDIEVELLKAESEVNLLTAKLKVRDNDADRESLRKSVIREHRAKLARARYDLNASAERLDRAKHQLELAKEKLATLENESELEQSYLSLLKKAGRNR